jgi:hypothetical protein
MGLITSTLGIQASTDMVSFNIKLLDGVIDLIGGQQLQQRVVGEHFCQAVRWIEFRAYESDVRHRSFFVRLTGGRNVNH